MHQTNHRGHNETSTATTQNQLAYKACRRWCEVSARPDATKHIGVQHINEYAAVHWISVIQTGTHFRCIGSLRSVWSNDQNLWMSLGGVA